MAMLFIVKFETLINFTAVTMLALQRMTISGVLLVTVLFPMSEML